MKFYPVVIGVVALALLASVEMRAFAQSPAAVAAKAPTAAAFNAVTDSLFNFTCAECHDSANAEGGFEVAWIQTVDSLTTDRDQWEVVLAKLKAREMPPPDHGKPPEVEIAALVKFVDAEFVRADAALKPDPGRVTARRLNRTEYTNTIRDLLSVEF
ncbi:MAG: DUF1587 domain-containing protein, partial [Pseudomonadota bacterium]